MPAISVFLDSVQELNAARFVLRRRLRTEEGMTDIVPEFNPGVVVKLPIEVQSMSVRDVHARTNTYAKEAGLKPVSVRALEPAEFDIDGTDDALLYLPLESDELKGLITNVLDFFENELHFERTSLERRVPHLVLVECVMKERREAVLSIAKSIAWPEKEVIFGTLVVVHQSHGYKNEWRIPLYRGP